MSKTSASRCGIAPRRARWSSSSHRRQHAVNRIGSRRRPRPSPTATTGPRRSRCCASRRATSSTSTRCSRTRRTGLARAGVPDDKIQASLKAIVDGVSDGQPRRGPGGHILTGPVYVEGAEPGDALEVKMLSIDLPIDYGYNGCSGFVPENCDRARRATKIIHARSRRR